MSRRELDIDLGYVAAAILVVGLSFTSANFVLGGDRLALEWAKFCAANPASKHERCKP